jgi:hypothetical protein
MDNAEIAGKLGCHVNVVQKWRARFHKDGIAGLDDQPRSGRKSDSSKAGQSVRSLAGAFKAAIKGTISPPRGSRWTVRRIAESWNVKNIMKVQRTLQANRLLPHYERVFPVLSDSDLHNAAVELVGVYLNPPEHAIVFAVKEGGASRSLPLLGSPLAIKVMDRAEAVNIEMAHGQIRDLMRTLAEAEWLIRSRKMSARARSGFRLLVKDDFPVAVRLFHGKSLRGYPASAHDLLKKYRGRCVEGDDYEYLWQLFVGRLSQIEPLDYDIHVLCDNRATNAVHPIAWRIKNDWRVNIHFSPMRAEWFSLMERWLRQFSWERCLYGHAIDFALAQREAERFVTGYNKEDFCFRWTSPSLV